MNTPLLTERFVRVPSIQFCEALIRCADEETCIIRVHREQLRNSATARLLDIEPARRLSHLSPSEVL